MTRRLNVGTIVGFGLLSCGCISLLGPEDLRFRLSLSQGVGLDREFAIGVDGLTIGAAAAIADIKLPLGGLSWVDVGIYKIRGDGENLVASAELPGWEPMVRVREADEEVKVFVKQNSKSVKGIVALVRESDELVVVRVKGNIGKLLEKLMEDGDLDLDFGDLFDSDSEPEIVSTPDDIRRIVDE